MGRPAKYILKTRRARLIRTATHGQPDRAWHTRAAAYTLEDAKAIAADQQLRSGTHLEVAVFHRGRLVAFV